MNPVNRRTAAIGPVRLCVRALGLIASALLASWPAAADEIPAAEVRASGTEVARVLEAHDEYLYMIEFSPDGRLMATASGDNTAVVWDAMNRVATHVLRHEAAVYAAALSPDGKSVATASGDGQVTLWNARSGAKIAQTNLHRDAVYSLAFAPDGKLLASGGGSTDGGDTTCRIWRASDLKLVRELSGHERQVYGVAFSPNGRWLATGSSDKTIRVWNVGDGESTILRGHTSDVYRCAFSPDGKRLATASQDGTVRVWSLESNSVERVLEGTRRNPFYGAVFSLDGRRLAAVSDDRQVRIWRTADWGLDTQQQRSRAALYAVAFSPDQRDVLVGGEDGKVYVVPAVPNE